LRFEGETRRGEKNTEGGLILRVTLLGALVRGKELRRKKSWNLERPAERKNLVW
jgi:hypothetical protein